MHTKSMNANVCVRVFSSSSYSSIIVGVVSGIEVRIEFPWCGFQYDLFLSKYSSGGISALKKNTSLRENPHQPADAATVFLDPH